MRPSVPPIRIKICGCTDPADFADWKGLPIDTVGLNFFPGSKRYLAPERRGVVASAVPAGLQRVGVFVNERADRIRQIAQECGLDAIQLHGDEPPAFEAELADLAIIRAIRCERSPREAVDDYFRRCDQVGVDPAATLLLDAYRPGEWGGTGATLPWAELAELSADLPGVRWMLAGGLTPENVAEAIELARPFGVDVAGGVERAPGQKDPAAVRLFAERANLALRKLNR